MMYIHQGARGDDKAQTPVNDDPVQGLLVRGVNMEQSTNGLSPLSMDAVDSGQRLGGIAMRDGKIRTPPT